MDYFTKWPEVRTVENMKADTIAKFIFEEIICRHGVPQIMLSDRGTSFVNKVIDKLCEDFQLNIVLLHHTDPRQTVWLNDSIEHWERVLRNYLKMMKRRGIR